MVAPLVRRASARHLWRHPWQLGLAVLGVALGVALAVAVAVANNSAARAFELSMSEVTGSATHQIIGGPTGLDEHLYTRLRVSLGITNSAPVVAGTVTVHNHSLRLLGMDSFARTGFGRRLAAAGRLNLRTLLTEPGAVLLPAGEARRLGLAVGAQFTLVDAGGSHAARLVGLLHTDTGNLMVADIATAQELLGLVGRLSWIDLTLPRGAPGRTEAARIRAALPAQAELVPANSRTRAMSHMTRAFRINLTAMSLLGLVVGMFLIYNTMTFAVLQRRRLLGALRVLGVTRRELFRLVLVEAAWLGTAGTLLGLALGVFLAAGLLHLVARTINDLYFAVSVSRVVVGPVPLLMGALLGIGGTLLAAAIPATEAAASVPQTVLHRSALEVRARRLAPRVAGFGILLVLGACGALALPSRSLVLGFVALFMAILGMTFITPLLVAWLTRVITAVAGGLLGVHGRLALRGVAASLSRTGAAVAALMLAVSTTVGVGVMVASFRATVVTWLETTLQADIYVSVPGPRSGTNPGVLDPRLIARVRALPGVATVATGRSVTVATAHGLTEVFALQPAPGRPPRYRLQAGTLRRAWPAFLAGRAVLVSEPYAYRHRITAGDAATLRTDRGLVQLPVAGVYYDYASGPGTVLMVRKLYNRYFDDPGVRALGVYLASEANLARTLERVRRAAGGIQIVRVQADQAIRRASLAIFDRTFTITNVLRLLTVLVAFVGILSALMALQLERARELAVLRATGFTPRQIGVLVTVQTGFMGLVAGILAIPAGMALAWMLIHVINHRAFGWTLQTWIPAGILLQGAALAVIAAVVAGLYPGWRMARISPAAALREE